MSIGGNVYAYIQCKTVETNDIAAQVEVWVDVQKVRGWLDLIDGDSKYTNFSAKMQESMPLPQVSQSCPPVSSRKSSLTTLSPFWRNTG